MPSALPPSPSRLFAIREAIFNADARADTLLGLTHKLGDVIHIPIPGKRIYLITHPRDVRRVLVEHPKRYIKSFDYRILQLLVGRGLLTADGDAWRRDRRMIQPIFHQAPLQSLPALVAAETVRLTENWARVGTIDASQAMTRLTLTIIGVKIFSTDISDFSHQIAESLETSQSYITRQILAIVPLDRWLPTPARRRFERDLARIDQWIAKLVERRRGSPLPVANPVERDLLSLLIEAQDPDTGQALTDRQIRDQVMTLFLAGHETTALALSWTLHLLSLHQDWQNRLRDELRESPGPLLQAVILESLRLYPPIAMMGREAIEQDEVGGYPIEPGTTLLISQYITHRRRDLWREPGRFDPGRFLTDEGLRQEKSFAYFPFGGGPRICIGNSFALTEISVALAGLLRDYHFTPEDSARAAQIRGVPYITLRPSGPIRLNYERV